MTDFEKIKKLKELLDSGALTEEEFVIEKNKILGNENKEKKILSLLIF